MRQDDPGAFKDIIVKIQDVTAGQGNKGSSRFKFMLELLEDLKSNKRKLVKGDSDLQGIGRKTFVSAIRRRGMTLMEPLKVTLKDARNKETNAKWLITGFARPKLATELAEKAFSKQQPSQGNKRGKVQLPTGDDDFDLVHLADTQKMNTDIRRAIFSILMHSNNYLDAYEKLLDLKMTKKQNREIPKVLLHCVGQEASSYNPYYGILANHFVQHEGKDYSLTLMFCLWDTVKELKSYKVSKIRNFGMFFGFLLGKKAIQLTALKVSFISIIL